MNRMSSLAMTAMMLAAANVSACGDGASTNSGSSGGLVVTVSAEGLGANGYAFPPAAGQEVAFVDGWEVLFDRIVVIVDNVRLSSMPDKNPGDQGQTGADVVRRTGPWALDLKKPGNELDKGGAGLVAIRLPIDDMRGSLVLEQRYAFGYDLVPATANAQLVNLAAEEPAFLGMVARGERVLVTGTATFKGDPATCEASRADYDFGGVPKSIRFEFGFGGPVSYANCQNPDNTGKPIEGEEAPRGIQLAPNAPTIAQITVHTDHLFWSTVSHENVPMFDQFAAHAHATEQDANVSLVTLDDMANAPIAPVTDSSGAPLPWRSCVGTELYHLPTLPVDMTFDPLGQPLRTLRDFVLFNAATMGHLNADGLCYVAGSGAAVP